MPDTREAAPPSSTPKPVEAGEEGPFEDAQHDGKFLDDVGSVLLPDAPGIPDVYLPFPGMEEGGLPGGPENAGTVSEPAPNLPADDAGAGVSEPATPEATSAE
ncbi:hypothetical protein [Streptomyces sp. NPDC051662]|uniref:hypothetical protein n=1 Tax=Streptomyces sp. NPDC051662 TaxID=3154750 RepID=UPI003431991B